MLEPRPDDSQSSPAFRPEESNDDLLQSYIAATDDRGRAQALEHLLTRIAAPVVASALRMKSGRFGASRRFDRADEEDITATVMYRMIRRLAGDLATAPIENFTQYVAATTAQVCNDHLRQQYPGRARVANAIRRTLCRESRFAIWRDGQETACGLREWRDRSASGADLDRLAGILLPAQTVPQILEALFRAAGEPLLLASVTTIVARHLGADRSPATGGEPPPALAPTEQPWRSIHLHRTAEAIWLELQELPPNQRVAVLLSMRDGANLTALRFFPLTGVATLRDLSTALGMNASELAELWPYLPMADLEIGARLGLTRQQVINLRGSARRRLERRLRAKGLL